MRAVVFFVSLSCFLVLNTPTIAQDLLVQYTFDEGDGVANDTGVGDPTNGTLGSTATRSDNTPGMASPFSLDLRAAGLDSFVNAGDAAEVDQLESFTLTTWLLLEDLNGAQDGSGNVRLLAKQAADPFDGFSWNLNAPNVGSRGTDNFRTGLFVGGENEFQFAFAAEDIYADEWAFLAVTYDGTIDEENTGFYFGDTEMEVFLLSDFMETLPAGPVNSTASEADFGIGFTDAAEGFDFAANGFMDDVRVYSGVLSLEQLEAVRLENLTFTEVPACDPNSGGDLNSDGAVDFADFLVLSDNFGNQVSSHTAGDIDCDGEVAFSDFLVLSNNFGGANRAAHSVPEPSATLLITIALFSLGLVRGRSPKRRD